MKIFLGLLLLAWSSSAMAAKNSTIQGKSVILHAAPDKNSDSILTLNDGDPVEISNYPTKGFYKTRTASGQVGWVEATSLGDESLPAPTVPPASSPPASEAVPEIPATPDVTQPPPTTLSSPTPPSTLSEPTAPIPTSSPTPPTTVSEPTAPIPTSSPTSPETENDPGLIPFEDVKSSEKNRITEKEEKPKGPRMPFELKVFGGIQTLQSVISFSQLGGTLFSSMPYFGFQFGIPLEDRLLLLLRIEHLSRSTTISDFNMSLSSTPVMTGLSYSLLDKHESVQLQASILIGVAMSTTLDATETDIPAPNLSELSTQAFTEMLKLDLDIPITEKIGFFVEGGYRFLNSSSIGPSSQNPSNSIFQTNGVNVPFTLNLSGFLIGGGIALLF